MNIEVFKLEPHDASSFRELVGVFAEVFHMPPFEIPSSEYLERLLRNPSFFAHAATVAGEVVGGITCYVLNQYYSTSSYVYVFDLAVHPRYQRQGLGTRLMKAVTDYSRSLGAEEVFVQADDEDVHALEFYRHTGGFPEKVTHFNYPLKPFET